MQGIAHARRIIQHPRDCLSRRAHHWIAVRQRPKSEHVESRQRRLRNQVELESS